MSNNHLEHITKIGQKRILITGARAPHALHLARTLNRKGHTIHIAETSHHHISRFSNAVEKNHIMPSPRFDKEQFLEKLIKIVQDHAIDLLIPTWEEALYISEALDRFPRSCTVFCSRFDLMHTLHNKWLFQKVVNQHNLCTPHTQLVNSKEDFYKVTVKKPFALKSSYSRAGQCIYKIDQNTACPDISFDPKNPWIAQEWIHGNKYCTYSICHQGKVTAHAAYPVKFAIDKNSCISFEAIEHKGIERWVKTFVKEVGFTGQIAFDFIEKEGVLYAIECNPRSTSGLYLFSDETDIDQAFFNQGAETVYPLFPTKKQIAVAMLMYGWRENHQNTSEPFLQSFLNYKDVVFNLKDPSPFLYQSWLYLYYIWKSRQMDLSIPALFTYDLDWNGESGIKKPEPRKAPVKKSTILFDQ